MPNAVVAMLAAVQIAGGQAAAAPTGLHQPNATLCLDTLGENHPPVCRAFTASRIDPAPDICQCLQGGLQVEAPYCAPGEAPQALTHAFELARRAAALHDLTLVGKTYQGRSFCVAGPQPPRP